MTYSPYAACVPPAIAMLTGIKAWLDKAADQIGEGDLPNARLAPDMYPLSRQVQIVSDTAKGAAARLAGIDAPSMPDTETTFAQLKDRCDATIAFLQGVDAAAIDGAMDKEVVLTFPNGGGMRFDGATYLTGFVLPNLYFHASMVYAILRNRGVDIGKLDFLAHLAGNVFPPPEKA